MAKQGSINYIDVELPPEEFTSIGFPALYILKGNNEIIKLILFDQFGNRLDSNLSFNGIATEEFVNQAISNAISNLKDNTLEFPTFADFPQPGEIGNVYIDLSEDKIYIWDSSTNSYISQSWNQTIINSIQTQILSLQNSKLNKPTTTSNTTSYPYVVGEDGNGNSARLPAGDLGKNFFNSDLSNTTARNHTMNAGVTVNTLGNPHTLSGLPNKNADITNFRKVRVQNTSGLDAVVDSKSMLLDMPSYLTEQERTAWKTAMNGGWTTNTMSIGMVYPNVVKYTDDIVYITIYGANLNLPLGSEIKIINVENNTEYVIPNSQVIYGDASKIYFWIKATDFAKEEYKIRIFNGVAIVETQSNNNLLFVDVVNEIDITSITWDKKSTTQSQAEKVLVSSHGILHFETDANNAVINAGGIVASAKSNIIANANENFVLEAKVEGKFSNQIS